MLNIQQANDLAKQLVASIADILPNYFSQDIEFYLSGLDRFQLIINADDDDADDKEEPEYSTPLPLSFFNDHIKTPYDTLVVYAHFMGHRKCDTLWINNRVPKTSFQRYVIDLLEDIYAQRIFKDIAPVLYVDFYKHFLMFDSYRPFSNRDIRAKLNSLMFDVASNELPIYFTGIHEQLYQSDPALQETFNLYIRYWYGILQVPEIASMLEQHDM